MKAPPRHASKQRGEQGVSDLEWADAGARRTGARSGRRGRSCRVV